MLDSITNFISGKASTVTNAVTNVKWEKFIPQALFDKWSNFTHHVLLTVVIIVVAIVLINTLFDVVKRIIRGLDVAALGVLFYWMGSKIPNIVFIRDLINPLHTLGMALIITGLVIFVVFKGMYFWNKKRKQNNIESKIRKKIDEE